MIFLHRFNVAHNDQLALIDRLKSCETIEEYKLVSDLLTSQKFNKVFYSHAEIVTQFKEANENDKEKMLLEALTNISVSDSEALALLGLHKDANGISYSMANIKNIQLTELLPMMMQTLIACSNLNCDFSLLSPDDLEMIGKKRINITNEANEVLTNSPNLSTSELISLTVKSILTKVRSTKK